MKIDINKLAEHFAHTSFRVEQVSLYGHDPGRRGDGYTEAFPGFVFPLRGKAEFVFGGTPYILAPGVVVHGGANMKLDRKVIGNTRWEYLLVHYRICAPEPTGFSLLKSHFQLAPGQSPRLTELLKLLWRLSRQPGGVTAFQTETIFRCVLEEIFVCVRNQSSDGEQALFEQISNYIHEHYMDALTVRALAEQNDINENRLFYVFKKYAGMGPGNYLMAYRLNQAKDGLLATDAPIGEVANSVGYADALYFSRLFKKQFGVSPGEFRSHFRNNPYGFQDGSIHI
ncbi:AraC family transcriptional regulator [Paenibacillus doosanensis]|uniref:HTH-type transcriptional regulator YesS n=1 Tax=Paenibacillus konkukensis TaxID=2020716 RepID=A0ABY4RMD9_9BACL|nr:MULTISPECIES: helix-turn-helix domain-containing protein [Paenibacillus]MCS7460053.1 AraC family transcriptional regulator [Paenibacillus doosanensis]UQZ82708.1 HTH-type transcriptional regulator YesS [Paenibacillus konkukensis]